MQLPKRKNTHVWDSLVNLDDKRYDPYTLYRLDWDELSASEMLDMITLNYTKAIWNDNSAVIKAPFEARHRQQAERDHAEQQKQAEQREESQAAAKKAEKVKRKARKEARKKEREQQATDEAATSAALAEKEADRRARAAEHAREDRQAKELQQQVVDKREREKEEKSQRKAVREAARLKKSEGRQAKLAAEEHERKKKQADLAKRAKERAAADASSVSSALSSSASSASTSASSTSSLTSAAGLARMGKIPKKGADKDARGGRTLQPEAEDAMTSQERALLLKPKAKEAKEAKPSPEEQRSRDKRGDYAKKYPRRSGTRDDPFYERMTRKERQDEDTTSESGSAMSTDQYTSVRAAKRARGAELEDKLIEMSRQGLHAPPNMFEIPAHKATCATMRTILAQPRVHAPFLLVAQNAEEYQSGRVSLDVMHKDNGAAWMLTWWILTSTGVDGRQKVYW